MIEAMEQQIINSINNRWTKDKNKRREKDIIEKTIDKLLVFHMVKIGEMIC